MGINYPLQHAQRRAGKCSGSPAAKGSLHVSQCKQAESFLCPLSKALLDLNLALPLQTNTATYLKLSPPPKWLFPALRQVSEAGQTFPLLTAPLQWELNPTFTTSWVDWPISLCPKSYWCDILAGPRNPNSCFYPATARDAAL